MRTTGFRRDMERLAGMPQGMLMRRMVPSGATKTGKGSASEERMRPADQRQQHQPENKQSPQQQQQVVVRQDQRLALGQVGEQLDGSAVGIAHNQRIEPARLGVEKLLNPRARPVDDFDQSVPMELQPHVHYGS